MQTGTFTDRTRADLYLALELAGTDAAQSALVSVMNDPQWSTKDGMRAIVALGGVNQPNSQTIEELWLTAASDRERLASTATFALGSLGGSLKSGNSPEYASLRDGLVNGAFSSADAIQRANFVLALGNTRDAQLAGDLASMLDDTEAPVRRAAAQSLGALENPLSVPQLVNRLQQETKGEVRAAIAESLFVLSSSDEATVEAVAVAIAGERDEAARLYMARFLGSQLVNFPLYKSLLQDMLRHEPSKRVRQAIGEALATAG